MGPLRPGERFHSGSRAEDVYWRLPGGDRQTTQRIILQTLTDAF